MLRPALSVCLSVRSHISKTTCPDFVKFYAGYIFSNDDTVIRWRRGVVVSGVRRVNEVNPRRARLVLGWVTIFGPVYHLGM